MKVIKLDRRYAGGSKWKYALQFERSRSGRLKQLQYANGFKKLFGADRELNPDPTVGVFSDTWYLYNEHWFKSHKHYRICYNDESVLSAVLLVME